MKKLLMIAIGLLTTMMLTFPQPGLAKNVKLRLQCVYHEKAYVGQTTDFFAKRV